MNDKTDGNSAKPQPKRPLGWLLTSLTIFLILGIASSLIAWIQFSEPTAQREGDDERRDSWEMVGEDERRWERRRR